MDIFHDTYIRTDIYIIANYGRSSFVCSDRKELAYIYIIPYYSSTIDDNTDAMPYTKSITNFCGSWYLDAILRCFCNIFLFYYSLFLQGRDLTLSTE